MKETVGENYYVMLCENGAAENSLSVNTENADAPACNGHCSRVEFDGGQTVAQAVYLSGIFAPPALCSGLGRCGHCAVRYASDPPEPVNTEKDFFSLQMLADGWRLGCRHMAKNGVMIALPASARMLPLAGIAPPDGDADATGYGGSLEISQSVSVGAHAVPAVPAAAEEASHIQKKARFIAVDIGTTSVHWQAYATETPQNAKTDAAGVTGEVRTASSPENLVCVGKGVFTNPQMGAGSDVISRVQFALSDKGRMTLSAISLAMLEGMVRQAGGAGSVFVAANPAMAAIAFGHDVSGLAHAPYALPDTGGHWESPPSPPVSLPPVWVAPHISPFVGGDISAGYAYLIRRGVHFPFLLADMGTNGEFILALSPEQTYATSVALGPALEGVNLTFGSEAKPGVITGFTASPLGLQAVFYEEKAESLCTVNPQAVKINGSMKISGTGYISLLSLLIKMRALTRSGQFASDGGLLAKTLKEHARLMKQGELPGRCMTEPCFPLPYGLYLYGGDVEEILKVKAAFSLGLERILAVAGIPFHGLRQVYLAGALGEHADTLALEELGFFPAGAHARVIPVGNAALQGIGCLAEDEALREWLGQWVKQVKSVNLADDAVFHEHFYQHMTFSYPGHTSQQD